MFSRRATRVRGGVDDESLGHKRAALRIAFGVTAGFAAVELFVLNASFLAPLLAAILLVKLERPPRLAEGLGLVALIGLSAGAVVLITRGTLSSPLVLILASALLLFLAFYAHRRGAPEFVTLFPQISAVTIPVVSVLLPQLAGEVASALASAGLIALLVVWAAYAAFPAPAGAARASAGSKRPAQAPPDAVRNALLDTLALLPALAWFLLDASEVAVVVLIVCLTLLRAHQEDFGLRVAAGVIVANLMGGIAAAIVYGLVSVVGTLTFFLTACLAACLVFAGRIVTAGDLEQVYLLALVTFLLLLGLGVAPLPGGSGELLIDRVVNVLLASAYTIGGLSLIAHWRPSRVQGGGHSRPARSDAKKKRWLRGIRR